MDNFKLNTAKFLSTVRQNLGAGRFTVVLRNKLQVRPLYTTR